MTLTDDDFRIKCLFGCPVFLDDICAVFPATLREIASLGYSKFIFYLNLLLLEKPTDIADEIIAGIVENLSNFEYLLLMTSMDKKTNENMKDAFRFFIHDSVSFSFDPPQIIVGPPEEKHILNEESFSELKKILKKMYFIDAQEDIEEREEDNPIVARIKAQMRKNREKLAKAKKVGQRGKTDMLFSDLIASLAISQSGLDISSIQNITYYAFHDQLKRFGWRDRFNNNHRAALAGAKLKKHELDYWIKSIDSKDK